MQNFPLHWKMCYYRCEEHSGYSRQNIIFISKPSSLSLIRWA